MEHGERTGERSKRLFLRREETSVRKQTPGQTDVLDTCTISLLRGTYEVVVQR